MPGFPGFRSEGSRTVLYSVRRGLNRAHSRTGCGGYLLGSSGQRMKVEVSVSMYRGGAAHRWQRLSGKGNDASGCWALTDPLAPARIFTGDFAIPPGVMETRPLLTHRAAGHRAESARLRRSAEVDVRHDRHCEENEGHIVENPGGLA